MTEAFMGRLQRCRDSVIEQVDVKPRVGIILGSGLSGIADAIDGQEISYGDIDGFPKTTIAGHRGVLKMGADIAIMAGRFHFYEGHDMDTVVLPVSLLHILGVQTLVVTNAAGGVNESFEPGDLILIKDHINLMGANPLIGPHIEDLGPRFPDMSTAYPAELRAMASREAGRQLKEGVYAALSGPCYETPAEIRMLRAVGADLVGMSTAPEVIAANAYGMRVLGISCVTNMAAGILDQPLSHHEVLETGKRVEAELTSLILKISETLIKAGT